MLQYFGTCTRLSGLLSLFHFGTGENSGAGMGGERRNGQRHLPWAVRYGNEPATAERSGQISGLHFAHPGWPLGRTSRNRRSGRVFGLGCGWLRYWQFAVCGWRLDGAVIFLRERSECSLLSFAQRRLLWITRKSSPLNLTNAAVSLAFAVCG